MFGSHALLIHVSLTGAANENGKAAEDSETIPDQTPAQGGDAKPTEEPAAAATSADTTAAVPPAAEVPQPAADNPPAEAAAPAAPAEAPAAAVSSAETAQSSSEPAAAAPAAPEQGRMESETAL